MKTVNYQFKNLILVLVVLALGIPGWAQQTRDQHPNASGLSATAQSIPGMSQAQREGLKNPEQGTLVYQNDNAAGYYMNEGTPEQPRWTPVTFGGQMPAPETTDNGSKAPLSGERGFLPPRLTDAQMNAIAGPAEGLLIYNYTQKKLCVYSNSAWDCTVFCKAPATPTMASWPGEVCNGVGTAYTINSVPNATSYTWTWTGGGSVAGNGTSATLTATSAGTLSCTATNSCGTSAAVSASIGVNTVPATPTMASWPGEVCNGVGTAYTINAVPNATSYTWTWTGGGSVTGNGTSATLTATSAGTLSCTATNSCGTSAAVSASIGVNTVPATPTMSNWPGEVCSGVGTTYTIYAVSGATSYTWSWTGAGSVAGNGTSATLTATGAGTLSCTANNSCGSSAARSASIGLVPLLTPGAITGDSPYCANQTEYFTISPVAGATSYIWGTNVSGGTISGTGTTGTFTGTSIGLTGNVFVSALNACGYSGDESTLEIYMSGPPATPASISGSGIQCKGKTYTYTCAASAGATSYTWSYSGSGTPSGTGTSATLAATGSGSLSVCASDVCGCSSTTQIGITAEGVYNSTTERCWEDRNMGATQVATSSTDADAYGYLYQWGRGNDGHQSRTSATTTTLSSTNSPGHDKFITIISSPGDWRDPRNDNLWQGLTGINNPCPANYRLPTKTEFDAERVSWSSQSSTGAFASPLKLTMAGFRGQETGLIGGTGSSGNYWNSTVSSTAASQLFFDSSGASLYDYVRASGASVRCIRDVTP